MIRHPAGRRLSLATLGDGRVTARVERREPMSDPGVPDLARRIRVRPDDGGTVGALELGRPRLTLLDPRHTEAG